METVPKLIVESKFDKYSFYLGNMILIAFFIYFLSVFNQNPILILILLVLLAFFILISTYKPIKVYSDKIEIIYKRLFKFNTSIKAYYFEDISSIEATLRIDGTRGFLLQFIGFFRVSLMLVSFNYFTLIFKNKKRKSISTEIKKEDLIKVFEAIKSLSDNKIEITIAQPNLLT